MNQISGVPPVPKKCATQLCHQPVPHTTSNRNSQSGDGTEPGHSCATPNVLNVEMAQQLLCHTPSDLRCYTPTPKGAAPRARGGVATPSEAVA